MTFSLRISRYKRRFHRAIVTYFILSLFLLQIEQSNGISIQNDANNETEPVKNTTDVATTSETALGNESESEKKPNTTACESQQEEPESAYLMLVYILICIYSFLGITVACHYYFVPSMSRICEDFKLSEDIVGATFMAAGSSAPELATVVIAVFYTEDDIGISDVIGSAVFNMLFVIALCGLFANTALHLNWWPLVRNCFFYTLSIIVMLIAIANEQVSWFESLLLIISYALYCVALYCNEFLEAWANTLPLPFNKTLNDDVKETDANYIPLEDRKMSTYAPTTERNSIVQSNGKVISSIQQTYHANNAQEPATSQTEENKPMLAPNAGFAEQMKYYFVSPVHFVCKWTIPDWQRTPFFKSYLLTFFVSLIWISVYSYIMIWTITIIGKILRIPNTVMGLTLVAAGVSVPDAVASLKVVREGYADMAISNAVGSNIFDILICLGVPWFLRTTIIRSRSDTVRVISKGMFYSTIMLLSTVFILIRTIYKNGWKLDKKSGKILMIAYFVFISLAVIYELLGGKADCEKSSSV